MSRDGKQVVCINNKPLGILAHDEDNSVLTIGKTYTIEKEDRHSWFSVFRLKEIPGKTFNSVLFTEL